MIPVIPMPLPKEQAWFPCKRYGYGWGLPSRWQGWLVFLGYVGAFLAGLSWFATAGPAYFIGYTFVITSLLVVICWWKGEPARWRWGDD